MKHSQTASLDSAARPYVFRFSPRFFSRRREVLGLHAPPPIRLPESVQQCLEDSQAITRFKLKALWFECLWRVRGLLVRSAFVASLTALFAVGATFFGMQILTLDHLDFLYACVIGYSVSSILGQVGVYFNNRIRISMNLSIQAFLVQLISKKLLRLSQRRVSEHSSGNLKVLISSDVDHVAEFLENVVRNLVPSVFSLIIVVPILAYTSGFSGVLAVLIMVAYLPISLFLNGVGGYFQNKSQYALDSLATLLSEWVKNVRLVRALSWGDSFEKDTSNRVRTFLKFASFQHVMACIIFGLSVSWWMVAIGGVFLYSHFSSTPLALQSFFASLWLVTFLSGYFIHLSHTIRLWSSAGPSMRRISHLLVDEEQADLFESRPISAPGEASNRSIEEEAISVVFDGVSFTYGSRKDPDSFALKGLSLEIPLDLKTAIVGSIGCGKSTLVKLLAGELKPTTGRVMLRYPSGKVRSLWNQEVHESFRQRLAIVPQVPYVSSTTLGRNIGLHLGVECAEEGLLLEAAHLAEMEEDLEKFPDGIHEMIGESGLNLSGGQRQRLNIARAYFSKRDFLILDDSLSAVDKSTERKLVQSLEDRSGGFLLITHRTDSIAKMDRVVVMEEGHVIEFGHPKEIFEIKDSRLNQILSAYTTQEPEDV